MQENRHSLAWARIHARELHTLEGADAHSHKSRERARGRGTLSGCEKNMYACAQETTRAYTHAHTHTHRHAITKTHVKVSAHPTCNMWEENPLKQSTSPTTETQITKLSHTCEKRGEAWHMRVGVTPHTTTHTGAYAHTHTHTHTHISHDLTRTHATHATYTSAD